VSQAKDLAAVAAPKSASSNAYVDAIRDNLNDRVSRLGLA